MKATFALMLATAFLLGAGRVQTRDGRALVGEVSFDGDAVVVRSPAEVRVPWGQVARVQTAVTYAPTIEKAKAGEALPAGWKAQDIGKVKLPGSATCDEKGTFTLTASGYGAWGAKDSFHFAYRTLKGDGQVIARVAKLDQSAGPVVAGVMMRSSLAPDSPMAAACLYPTGEVRLARRPLGTGRDFKPAEEPNPQSWVRLTRRGEIVRAFRSADGKVWEQTETHKVPMGEDVLVGACAWATGNDWRGTAVIESLVIVPGAPALTYAPGADPLEQGIVKRDGSVIACRIVSTDASGAVRYDRDGATGALALDQIARLVFAPIAPDAPAPSEKTGALMTNGDFFEGELTGIVTVQADRSRPPKVQATVRSIAFGSRALDVAREVVAIDLAGVTPAAAAYEVRTADHSLIRATAVEVRGGAVIVDGAATAGVVEVKRL